MTSSFHSRERGQSHPKSPEYLHVWQRAFQSRFANQPHFSQIYTDSLTLQLPRFWATKCCQGTRRHPRWPKYFSMAPGGRPHSGISNDQYLIVLGGDCDDDDDAYAYAYASCAYLHTYTFFLSGYGCPFHVIKDYYILNLKSKATGTWPINKDSQ